MARRIRNSLQYFPVAVKNHDDIYIEALITEFGAIAEFIEIKLRCLIFENSFYTPWNHLFALQLAKHTGAPIDLVHRVIERMLEYDMIDRSLLETRGILTGRRYQLEFFQATMSRSALPAETEFFLIDVEAMRRKKAEKKARRKAIRARKLAASEVEAATSKAPEIAEQPIENGGNSVLQPGKTEKNDAKSAPSRAFLTPQKHVNTENNGLKTEKINFNSEKTDFKPLKTDFGTQSNSNSNTNKTKINFDFIGCCGKRAREGITDSIAADAALSRRKEASVDVLDWRRVIIGRMGRAQPIGSG